MKGVIQKNFLNCFIIDMIIEIYKFVYHQPVLK